MNTYTATEPQKKFLADLLGHREVPLNLASEIASVWNTMTKKDASVYIDMLKPLPIRKPKVIFEDSGEKKVNPLHEALGNLPTAKYAVPSYIVDNAVDTFVPHGDIVFFEVKTYMGTPYLRNLVGGYQDFAKNKLTWADSLAVAEVLASNPVAYIQKFGEVFTCCGKCSSPLTDEKSRAMFLGPDCRKMLGL